MEPVKYKYNAEKNSVDEQPTMLEPRKPSFGDRISDDISIINWQMWVKHLKELKSFPVHGEHKWVDGQELINNKDFLIFDTKDARLISDVLGLDHKKMPLSGQIAVVETKPLHTGKIDSNPLAFYSPVPIANKQPMQNNLHQVVCDKHEYTLVTYTFSDQKGYSEMVCKRCGVKKEGNDIAKEILLYKLKQFNDGNEISESVLNSKFVDYMIDAMKEYAITQSPNISNDIANGRDEEIGEVDNNTLEKLAEDALEKIGAGGKVADKRYRQLFGHRKDLYRAMDYYAHAKIAFIQSQSLPIEEGKGKLIGHIKDDFKNHKETFIPAIEEGKDAIEFAEYINNIGFKKYSEGWCEAGGSNGWHCTSEELYLRFKNNPDG